MNIKLSDYEYSLPEEKIAKHPLGKREDAKLLFYNTGKIEHHFFHEITELLPEKTTLVFNDTKVIPARLYFYKSTGALIEIFLLRPLEPIPVHVTMEEKVSCSWSCMIGNLKKWKEHDILERKVTTKNQTVNFSAMLKDRSSGKVIFKWDNDNISFAELLEHIGEVPLPPYLNRKADTDDKSRYQTVYSKNEGAVAAPTAGLHFTNDILKKLELKNIHKEYLTLHVSAGTFQPVKDENVVDHIMHSEVMVIRKETVRNLLKYEEKIIAVGTTSMRSLESLYWFGVKLIENKDSLFSINKLDPYNCSLKKLPTRREAIGSILDYMENKNLTELYGSTEIFIIPGYKFRICDGLITNFHLPKSTLILLIAAFVGNDWKKIYNEALSNNYRFLSYGDSSFLLPESVF